MDSRHRHVTETLMCPQTNVQVWTGVSTDLKMEAEETEDLRAGRPCGGDGKLASAFCLSDEESDKRLKRLAEISYTATSSQLLSLFFV